MRDMLTTQYDHIHKTSSHTGCVSRRESQEIFCYSNLVRYRNLSNSCSYPTVTFIIMVNRKTGHPYYVILFVCLPAQGPVLPSAAAHLCNVPPVLAV